jgi:hypothetical protein
MFNLICGIFRNETVHDFEVEITGCPWSGVNAVDFRRKNGLPEEPSNKIKLQGRMFNDEAACRRLKAMNSNADVNLEYIYQYSYSLNAANETYKQDHPQCITNPYRGHIKVSPKTIIAYVAEATAETAEALLKDVLSYEIRSKEAAQKMRKRKKEKLSGTVNPGTT